MSIRSDNPTSNPTTPSELATSPPHKMEPFNKHLLKNHFLLKSFLNVHKSRGFSLRLAAPFEGQNKALNSVSLSLFFMGNYITCLPSDAAGRVILSDGTVHEFDKPLTVAELMLEHSQQVVVEWNSAVNERRPTPLPADTKLEANKIYIMLPVKRGKPAAMSSEEVRRVLLTANSVLRSRSLLSSSRFLPLFARICPAGLGDEQAIVQQKKEPVERFVPELLPEILDERPDYMSRQLSGKGWKPSLVTINEKKVKKKLPHWLF